MNNPLRYNGETFYQASFDPDNDRLEKKVTILQVVHNPGWLTPYLSCALGALGLMVQFGQHLFGFAKKRSRSPSSQKPAPASKPSRSEEHTSELQSRLHLVCRLL